MIACEKEGLKFFKFQILDKFKNLSHGIFTRKGGKSTPPYDSLNLNLDTQDNAKDIIQNLEKVTKSLNFKNTVWAKQVHKDDIIEVNSQNYMDLFECDGFITSESNITLLIKHADCQAALFYDPVKNIVANVHCGWRGNVLNIYKKTLEKMHAVHKCDPKDLIVCISPSLGPKHAQFINYEKELPEHFWPFKVVKHHFNFWEIAKNQLINCHIKEENIEIAQICTYENDSDFFSYRRDKETGRNVTFIQLLDSLSTN